MKRFCLILTITFCFRAVGGEVLPPKPDRYFNDYAHVTSTETAARLNQTLENFERESSIQLLAAVFGKMESDSSIEDYTVRIARAWQAGQKDRNNGAVLFAFIQDRKMYIQVGYGLEGVLPDAICKRIIEEEIAPRFRTGDFDGGLSAGLQALIAAAKGEYKGTGRTVADRKGMPAIGVIGVLAPVFFVLLMVMVMRAQRRRGTIFRSRGRGGWGALGGLGGLGGWGGGGWSGGGRSSGGGGFSGGGGGGFSGGGGSFGGGGAGGSW